MADALISIVKPSIHVMIEKLKEGDFDFSLYSFIKRQRNALTNKAGLYLIVNKRSKKLYLGSTKNLTSRKADYKQNFKNPLRFDKVYTSMHDDLNYSKSKGQDWFQDFYFIPLVFWTQPKIDLSEVNQQDSLPCSHPPKGGAGVGGVESAKNSSTKELSNNLNDFLDLFVEKPLLDEFLISQPNFFYNTKSTGKFQKGNTYGGAPNSGTPKKPVSCDNFIWESVTAAAVSFEVTPATIRNTINKKLMQYEKTSNNNMEGKTFIKKINSNSTNLSNLTQTEKESFLTIKQRLFPRKN